MEGLKDAAAVAVRGTSLSGDEKNTAELKGCVRVFITITGVSITVASIRRRSVYSWMKAWGGGVIECRELNEEEKDLEGK